jgi:hypothetical protein
MYWSTVLYTNCDSRLIGSSEYPIQTTSLECEGCSNQLSKIVALALLRQEAWTIHLMIYLPSRLSTPLHHFSFNGEGHSTSGYKSRNLRRTVARALKQSKRRAIIPMVGRRREVIGSIFGSFMSRRDSRL